MKVSEISSRSVLSEEIAAVVVEGPASTVVVPMPGNLRGAFERAFEEVCDKPYSPMEDPDAPLLELLPTAPLVPGEGVLSSSPYSSLVSSTTIGWAVLPGVSCPPASLQMPNK